MNTEYTVDGASMAPTAIDSGIADATDATVKTVPWNTVHKQPPGWYATPAAAAIAENILYYQNSDGGWPKNIDMTQRTAARERSTIDNSGTTMQMIFLAKVFTATGNATYESAFLKGLDYLLAAQYANGGWPQYYPNPTGYYSHITFNDGAMIHVMRLLRDIANKLPDYTFVDDARVMASAVAVQKGIDCILRCQIVVDGVKTGWCAQHDEVTLAPAQARAYELPSESGQEGAGVWEFLMEIERPTPEIVDAIESARRWFEQVQIDGIKVEQISDPTQSSGKDVVVVSDPTAKPLWARFYEIGTNRPFFCGRDGIKKYSLAEIENERRTGYSWYGDEPSHGLDDFKTWQPEWDADAGSIDP
jgi:PelA/Pel-15E family pectate lyase